MFVAWELLISYLIVRDGFEVPLLLCAIGDGLFVAFGVNYYLFPAVELRRDGLHISKGYFKGFHPWTTIRDTEMSWWIFGLATWVHLRNGRGAVMVLLDHPWRFDREVRLHVAESTGSNESEK